MSMSRVLTVYLLRTESKTKLFNIKRVIYKKNKITLQLLVKSVEINV